MGTVCRFTCGSRTFTISGIYQLASGFEPPATLEVADIATGGSANKFGGGELVSTRTLPRDYSFSILVKGNSVTQNDLAIDRLDTFLRSGSNKIPVYFEWNPSADVSAQPYWGQYGATRKAKVLKGHCEKSGEAYLVDDVRMRMITADVTLTLNPVEGKSQRMGIATGGILENRMFSPDGSSRGLIIPEATTNLIVNPVFGNTDPDNAWATGAGLKTLTNTDKEFVYYGCTNSIVLSCGTVASGTFAGTLNVGTTTTHTFSAYVKKPDGSTAGTADAQIFYGAAQTSSYTALGNGVTRISYSGAGTNADVATGIKLNTVGADVYLMGYQAENKPYPTPLAYGDLMGNAWTGAAHASTSTRTAARWSIRTAVDGINYGEGTIRLVWTPDKANTALTADVWLFGESDGKFEAKFGNADEKFYFTDGVNTISSSATTFAADTPMVLHFTYSSAGLKIYRAGVEIATGATFTPTLFSGSFYLGTDELTAAHCNGTFAGFQTYRYALSATEIANDYANVWQHVSAGDGYGQCLEPIPWIFSLAAYPACDAYCDSTHRDWIICGGVPGSYPAETKLYAITGDDRSLLISNHQSQVFHNPSDYFANFSGSADASALGGSVYVKTNVGATPVYGTSISIAPSITRDLSQYPVRLWASLSDAGSALRIAPRVELNISSAGHTGDYRPISTGTALKQFVSYSVSNMENPEIRPEYLSYAYSDTIDYELWLSRTSGTANVSIDYMRVMFGDLSYVYNDIASSSNGIILHGNTAFVIFASSLIIKKITTVQGNLFELHPDTLNHVIMLDGDIGSNTDLTADVQIAFIDITPRYALA